MCCFCFIKSFKAFFWALVLKDRQQTPNFSRCVRLRTHRMAQPPTIPTSAFLHILAQFFHFWLVLPVLFPMLRCPKMWVPQIIQFMGTSQTSLKQPWFCGGISNDFRTPQTLRTEASTKLSRQVQRPAMSPPDLLEQMQRTADGDHQISSP